ncbi:uncharacterized protein LOC131951030 [Physella acuta]|uniref:uncharacterized protein LOC131951030 n=1 Tax=Physella acuta TaxID=109671 RepID=UPI0027DBF571|nr:uncharacterized protein LOC131951030 [Physella acuta]
MLDSAIDSLKQNGVRYFLKCALVRKAIVLFRQGDHPHSLEYFSKARSMTAISEECTDPFLKVSKLQEEEEDLTAEIYETIPMIFSGNNVEAREQLNQLRRKLKEKSFDHPELSTLLNNIGLTCQRGNKDSRAALKWYKKAYLERRHLEKICPESLVVMLNNIGMIHYELKELDTAKTYIRKAVEIGRRSRWPHSNTALAFVHLSIINFKEKNFMETLRLLVEADTMMLTIGRNYEFRLRITESLLHVRVIISQLGLTPGAGESEDVERLLKKSAADILRDLLAIGSTVKGHLSDEGHSRMLAAYEHGIILHWNVLEEREQYKQELLHYAHANGWVRSVLLSNKDITRSKSEQLVKHRPLYDYLVRTEDLQLSEVTRHVFDTCTYCAIVRQYYTDQIWSNHVQQQQMVARG